MSKFFYILILILTTSTFAVAQNKNLNSKGEESKDEALKYLIRNKFAPQMYHAFRMTEYTTNIRRFDNGDSSKFVREVTYYFTIVNRTKTDDGFLMVSVAIDSMEYSFKNEMQNIYNNSQSDEVPPLNNNDFMKYFHLNSREFDMYYSPYGDVAKLEGEMLDEVRNDVLNLPTNDEASKEFQKFMIDRFSDNNLIYITEPLKMYLPQDEVIVDSSKWEAPTIYFLAEAWHTGKADLILNKMENGKFFISGNIDKLKTDVSSFPCYDIKATLIATDVKSSGEIEMEIFANGRYDIMRSILNSTIKGKLGALNVTQETQTIVTWELLRTYKL